MPGSQMETPRTRRQGLREKRFGENRAGVGRPRTPNEEFVTLLTLRRVSGAWVGGFRDLGRNTRAFANDVVALLAADDVLDVRDLVARLHRELR